MTEPAAKPPALPEETVRKFLDTFAKHFDEHMHEAITDLFSKKYDYLRFAASLFPREMPTGAAILKGMSDDKLAAMLRYVSSATDGVCEKASEEIQET